MPSVQETLNNNLAINAKKTKSMLVISKRLRKRTSSLQSYNLDLLLDDTAIEQVENFKLLGSCMMIA